MKIKLKHPSGMTKEVKKGFSWTTWIFGLFVPLIRGDLKWAAILFLLQSIAGSFTFGIGAFVVSLVFAFKYNKLYVKELLAKGYEIIDSEELSKDAIRAYVNS
jgi:hypothetical protein